MQTTIKIPFNTHFFLKRQWVYAVISFKRVSENPLFKIKGFRNVLLFVDINKFPLAIITSMSLILFLFQHNLKIKIATKLWCNIVKFLYLQIIWTRWKKFLILNKRLSWTLLMQSLYGDNDYYKYCFVGMYRIYT